MSDDPNSGVIEGEAATPDVIDQQLPQENVSIEEAIAAQASSDGSAKIPKDENMRRMRESMETLQRQNHEMQAQLSAMVRPRVQTEQVQEPPDETESLAEDDFVNVGQMKKYAVRVAQQAVKQALKEQKGQTIEERFRAQNPDYDEVVTKENLETLFRDVPELKPTLTRLYDMALKGEDVDPVAVSYKLIKKFNTNIGESSMSTKKAPEVGRLAENSSKPMSSNAIKSSALTQAHKYGLRPSKEEATRLYKETLEASKGR